MADSLSCREQYFCSHVSSYSHYLREAGEEVNELIITDGTWEIGSFGWTFDPFKAPADVVFALDRYRDVVSVPAAKRIAQVAAITNPLPWEVRRPDGSQVYDLILSSIPALVDQGRAAGARCEYMPLAFDVRARAAVMGVKRERKAIFIGTRSPNHRRREEWLAELADIVEMVPPVFGREYFRRIAGATVLLQIHAEWSKGCANSMKMYEGPGAGAAIVADGQLVDDKDWWGWRCDTVSEARADIMDALEDDRAREQDERTVLTTQTYECADRVPRLVEMVRAL